MNSESYIRCSTCNSGIGHKYDILNGSGNIELKFYLNALKANINLKTRYLNLVNVELEKRFKEYTRGEDDSFKSFIKNDHAVCISVLELAFDKGSYSVNSFYKAETAVRELIFSYLCKFVNLPNVKLYCTNACSNFNIEKIYRVTDNRLGEEGVAKLISRIKKIETLGSTLSGLVYHKGKSVSVILGKKPYHLIFNYENTVLNVTPYCIWIESLNEDIVSADIKYVYNNIANSRFKGSLITMKDTGNRKLEDFAGIELAYKFYNGRISIENLLGIKK